LRNSQLSLLVALDQAGEISIGALADWLRMDRTTLTRNASVLEQRGLIGAREDENDRRSRILSITDEGRRAAGEAFPYWEKAQREIAALIGDESLAACVAGANALAERLGQQTA
jgi:DNA-binding MarR family transcriptional regulator